MAGAVDSKQEEEYEKGVDATYVEPTAQRVIAGGIESSSCDCGETGAGFSMDKGVDDSAASQSAENGHQSQGCISESDEFCEGCGKVEVEWGIKKRHEIRCGLV